MQRVNEYRLYELAIVLHPLTELNHDDKYSNRWLDLFNARAALVELFNQRHLEVCVKDARDLYDAIVALVPADFDKAVAKYSEVVNKPEDRLGFGIHAIKQAAEKFETVLSAELHAADTYFISPTGTHKTSVLLERAHTEIPASVLAEVPEEAKEDFDQAGKCLAFDTASAAGFHLMRATESVIRKYYTVVTGKEAALKFRNWGAYIKVLKQCGAEERVTGCLDHIRVTYRNPILHPEVTLSTEEAQVLFGLCVSAIVTMALDMKKRANKPATLPFPAVPAASA